MLIGAPLALFIPVRLQLHHWYVIFLAAALLPHLLFAAISSQDLLSFWHNLCHRGLLGGYPSLCAVMTCSLYLWLLRRSVRRRHAPILVEPANYTYKM